MSTMTRNFLLFLLVITSTGLLYAQGGAYGTILGTVADNSGAVVANASVDVTNTATNVTNHVQTSSSGDYTVPYLQPGTYRVTVQAQGFQKSITDGVILVVAQQERVNDAITEVRRRHAELAEVQRPAQAGDVLRCTLVMRHGEVSPLSHRVQCLPD